MLGPVDYGFEKLGEDESRKKLGEDMAQLTLCRDVVDDELSVDHPNAQLHAPDREVFISTAVAFLQD